MPLAMTTAVSLVDVSVSMLTQLNVRSITRRNTADSTGGSIAASVNIAVIKVPMSGSIIPTPFAMPVTVMDTVEVDGRSAVIPQVTGMAYRTGEHVFSIDPHDPLVPGFVLR